MNSQALSRPYRTRPASGGPARSPSLLFAAAFVAALPLAAAAVPVESADRDINAFFVHGYATINYYNFDWQTDPQRRDAVDLERLAIESAFQVNDRLRFEAEIEFEHGGTGSAMEFDKFEEFGEFESEIEKGGEIQVEELCVIASFHPALNLRLGHIFVPIGYAYLLDEPTDYLTVTRSETESNLIPLLWHETGAELFGAAGPLEYQVQVVNGLDATGFSSGTWIALGHQGRFETVNAENLAVAGRLDFHPARGATLGAAGYWGNSADNRPKPDLKVSAYVGIGQAHAEWRTGPLLARGLFMYGYLENAGQVSQANRNLSNNLNVKRSPVGSSALGWFAEAGFDVLAYLRSGFAWQTPPPRGQSAALFARFDSYDTMRETEGGFYNNPRWDRETWTFGANYRPHPRWILKGQYSRRTLGTPSDDLEQTYSLGTGLVF